MKIVRFEDVKAWQAARKAAEWVSRISESHKLDSDPNLRRQMTDASTSAMANIAEGFKSGSDREFVRFLRIATRSAAEVQSHLYVALDRMWIKQSEFDEGYRACEDTKGLIGGFIRYLLRPRPSGSRKGKVKRAKTAGGKVMTQRPTDDR
jgi:four helix bundle protein